MALTPGYYLITIYGDVDAALSKRFETEQEREHFAIARSADVELNDGLYWLDIDRYGVPAIGAYSPSQLNAAVNLKNAVQELRERQNKLHIARIYDFSGRAKALAEQRVIEALDKLWLAQELASESP